MIEKLLENIHRNAVFPIRVNGRILHIYYEGVWIPFDTEEEEKLCLVKLLIEKALDMSSPPNKLINAIYSELQTLFQKMDQYIDDKDNIYVNLKNSLLKIDHDGNIHILEHDAELGFRWKLGFDYDEKAECPLFKKYLKQVILDDDAISVLQEYLGYILLPHDRLNLHATLWLYGSKGSNGKSVLTQLLPFIYGEENTSYLDPGEFGEKETRMMMKGKLLNISSDASSKIDSSAYKRIASGETMTAYVNYKGSAMLRSLPKLVIASNDKIKFFGSPAPFINRMIIVPFPVTFKGEERDIHLGKKLQTEIPGIFNFALEGLQRLLKQGHFTHSKVIEDARAEYYGELDIMEDFLADNPIVKMDGKGVEYITQSDLFKRAHEWCKGMGKKNSYPSARSMRDKLVEDYGFQSYKNNTIYGIKGRWKTLDEMRRAVNNDDYDADGDIQDIYTTKDS